MLKTDPVRVLENQKLNQAIDLIDQEDLAKKLRRLENLPPKPNLLNIQTKS